MSYALVYYLNINTQRINKFRQKYDPQFSLIEPHITLVFPLLEYIEKDNLTLHIKSVLSAWKPFSIHLQGFQKSWDEYLFLMVQEGKENVIKLHNDLYTGILAEYCRENTAFVPHLTLGVFTKNRVQYSQALEEVRQLDLDYCCIVDKLNLLKITDVKRQIVWSQEYILPTSA
ncbi:MAG: 2'-5' RNA ligase family protein [Nostoc sp. NOS(2021)]|uniref:2'-5' RNA ligase family protein n=1 Tax=Nostoc sp. NOS(2021) TaxID=2815407 RepID=UPI0025EB3D9C|nr:2'-5' RNA ligase family protein [Nostoc sp. NOS(2021)]MBN3893774.1 2'-5' RNA ligase family protein [Nostoc sp. NOS(2021)]